MPTPNATSRNQVTINLVPEFTGKMPKMGIKLFLDEYLRDFNGAQAAVRVGKTKNWAESHGARLIREHAEYVAWQQKIRAVENARMVALDQDAILSEMEKIANANLQDYYKFEDVKDPKTKKVVRTRRWKFFEELTRDQAAAVKRVVMARDGSVDDYVLYDKDSNLFSLGRHLGMFSEKVILEHRHKHLHAKVDLSNMPINKLLEMEEEFHKYIPEHKREAS